MNGKLFARINWPLILAVVILIFFSWPYLRSASYRSAPDGQGYYTSSPQKQLVWHGVGVLAAIIVLAVSYRTFGDSWVALYALGILSLIFVRFFGVTVNGSRRWLDLPGVRLQPSEFVKIIVVISLAHYWSYERNVHRSGRLIKGLLLAGIPMALIMAQPDLGTALMVAPAVIAMMFVAGAKFKHMALIALAAVLMLPVLWLGMTPTQKGRVTTWVSQNRNLTHAERMGRFHHLLQSKIAIGSGGLTGTGLEQGSQNRLNFLSFGNTDFIFPVICEEAGFVGAIAVILLYLLLLGSGLGVAEHCHEPFGRILAVGITTLIVSQALVNIGMTSGLLPIVGLTLPFVSYGGSSTVSCWVALALILNVAMRRPRDTFSKSELGLGSLLDSFPGLH